MYPLTTPIGAIISYFPKSVMGKRKERTKPHRRAVLKLIIVHRASRLRRGAPREDGGDDACRMNPAQLMIDKHVCLVENI